LENERRNIMKIRDISQATSFGEQFTGSLVQVARLSGEDYPGHNAHIPPYQNATEVAEVVGDGERCSAADADLGMGEAGPGHQNEGPQADGFEAEPKIATAYPGVAEKCVDKCGLTTKTDGPTGPIRHFDGAASPESEGSTMPTHVEKAAGPITLDLGRGSFINNQNRPSSRPALTMSEVVDRKRNPEKYAPPIDQTVDTGLPVKSGRPVAIGPTISNPGATSGRMGTV
jgi:hypothetical protein